MSSSQLLGSYSCSGCGADVARDTVRCPACQALLSGVKCKKCKYVGPLDEFDDNYDRCPRCFPPGPRIEDVTYPSDIRAFERRGDVDGLIAALGLPFSTDNLRLSQEARFSLKATGSARAFLDTKVRTAAVEALGRLGGAQSAKVLIQALGDVDPSVRHAARRAFTPLRSIAVSAFIEDLENKAADVRREAVRFLGEWECKEAVEPLVRVLEDKRVDIREDAVVALGKLGARSAVAGIAERLTDSSPRVRLVAVRTLGELGDPLAIASLAKALAGAEVSLRNAIVEALDKFGITALAALTQVLGDDSPKVRLAAVEALVRIGDPAEGALTRALEDDSPEVRLVAAQALGQSGSSGADALARALGDDSPKLRLAAAVALGTRQSRAGVPTLKDALTNPDPEVRFAAAVALGKLGERVAVGALGDALIQAADAKTRQIAAELLGRLKDPAAAEPLGKALEYPGSHGVGKHDRDNPAYADYDVRVEVAKALRKVGGPAALAAATKVVDNWAAGFDTRELAISVLGSLGAGAEGPLLRALQDSDSSLRIAAAKELGHLGNPRAVPSLINELKRSKKGEDIAAAAKALADLGAQSARPHLLKAAKKEMSFGNRDVLRHALRKLESPKAVSLSRTRM